MKKFARLMVFFCLILLVAVSVMLLPSKAAAGKTIYISDRGTGDGSSASSPLGPESVLRVPYGSDTSLLEDGDPSNDYQYYTGSYFYKNSVLYQAAEKIAETGGNIVLVGDVVIDYSKSEAGSRTNLRDFCMPTHKGHINISAQNSASLVITEGAYVNLGGRTTFDNITIVSKTGRNTGDGTDYNLAICCGGYETVFGSNVQCVYKDAQGNAVTPPSDKYYLSIAGTKRFGDLTYDTNVTVNGGTWNCIYGGLFGNGGDVHRGDITVNINGGNILGNIVGGGRENSIVHIGDININITGGVFKKTIYVTNTTGAGYKNAKANVNISGGTFQNGTWLRKYYNNTLVSGGLDIDLTVDLSGYPGTSVGTMDGDTIYYPATMVRSASVKTQPTGSVCFKNEKYDATGLSVSVEYTNGKKADIVYKKDAPGFTINCDSSKKGTATVTGKYGNVTLTALNKKVDVINSPVPSMLGAQININDDDAGIRFVAQMKNIDDKNFVLKDYGILAFRSDKVSDTEVLTPEKLYGIDKLSAKGTKFRQNYDNVGIFNNGDRTTFCAVYENVPVYEYNTNVTALAYVEYEYNGQTGIVYSSAIKRNVLDIANRALAMDGENKTKVQALVTKYNTYTSDKADKSLSVYDSANAEKLRDIVVNEMNKIANYKWTPSSSINLTETVTANGSTHQGKYTYTAGTTYYGMLYVSNRKSEFKEFEQYIKTYKDGKNVYLGPVQGVNDFYTSGEAFESVESNKGKIDEKYHEIESFIPATDFTGIIVNTWNKVGTNNVWPTGLTSFIPSYNRGVLAVGNYKYSASRSDTSVITQTTGEAGMKAAYALCKRGDVLVNASSSGRSIYMVMADVKAGDTSVSIMTFSPTLYNVKQGSTTIGYTHFKSETKTMSSLFSDGYIPVTIPELATGYQARTDTALKDFDGAQCIESGVMNGKIESNKQIISVNVKLSRFDDKGEFFDETVYCNTEGDQNVNIFYLDQFVLTKAIKNLVGGKEYKLSVNIDVANEGVYELASYKFTNPIKDVKAEYAFVKNDFGVDMSNLGQSVVNGMRKQMDIYWTPANTFKYENLTGATGFVAKTKYTANTVYRGILYANTRATLPDFNATLDKTPTYNSKLGKNVYTLSGVDAKTDWNYQMGNHCSAAMYYAYQQVIRLHADSRGNTDMELVMFGKDIYNGVAPYTNSVIKLYGNEAVYEAYAQAKMGDFVYKRGSGGHTRIVQSVNVVRNSTTGRIDPAKSTILMIENTDTLESTVYGNADHGTASNWNPNIGYDSTWWEHTYTFELLASGNAAAILLRPTEIETGESEAHYIGLTKKANADTLASDRVNMLGIVESNYPILAVTAKVELADGTVFTATERALMNKNTYNVADLFTTKQEIYTANPGRYLYRPLFKGEKYTYTLTAELAVGTVVLDSFSN